MSVRLVDGNTTVYWTPIVADVAAPTAAEIGAGAELQSFVTQDGLDISADQAVVSISVLNSLSELADWGRTSVSTTLTMVRDSEDTAWTAFAGNEYGFLVVRRGVDNTQAIASGDVVEVYPSRASNRFQTKPAANEMETFVVKLALTDDYSVESVISA